MEMKPIAIYGINVDQRGSTEIVEAILQIIEDYHSRQGSMEVQASEARGGYVATLNTDFLANALNFGWNFPRHPELVESLRNSSIVTPDGMPIVFLAKFLGCPFKERVAGADLVPLLGESLGNYKKRVFLLGASDKVNEEAKNLLEMINPGLKVVGTNSSLVMTEGMGLSEAFERDALILEEIHKSRPDVLLISLGHPKQELWFARVKDRLRVPVAIGIGGTLNFLTGHTKRAPKWMQSIGLEWAFRLYTDPKRLFVRYLYDALFFIYLAAPLLLFHTLNRLLAYAMRKEGGEAPKDNLLFLSEKRSAAVVRIPEILNGENIDIVQNYVEEAFLQDAVVIDFQKASHMDLIGLGLIASLWAKAKKENKSLIAFGINWRLGLLLRLHRIWDIVKDDVCKNANEVVHRLFQGRNRSSLYVTYHQDGETLTVSFLGTLENANDYDLFTLQMEPMLPLKNCRVDLTFCNVIESMGFYFLLKLKQLVEANGRGFTIRGVSKELARQFKNAGLLNAFKRE